MKGKRRTLHWDDTCSEASLPYVEHAGVIGSYNGHNVHAGLHCKVKRSLLESAQFRPVGVAARAFGEYEDVLPLPAHLLRGTLEGFQRVAAVPSVDEHCAGRSHEPAEEGNPLEAGLGRHRGIRWEYGAQE